MNYHYTESGLDNVYLKNGFTIEHDEEHGDLISITNTRGLHKAIACEIATKKGPLTGDEFRFLRTELNLSQPAIGLLLDVKKVSVGRWENGDVDVPRATELVIRNYYLELKFGKNQIKELTDQLADLDAKVIMQEILLEESENDWVPTTIAA